MTTYNPEDYYRYRIQRAIESIEEIEKHIENKFWNTAINRMYYACFYAVNALLIKNGIETASHSGTRHQFGKIFVKSGKIDRELAKHFTKMYERRQKGDYNDFYDFDEATVKELFPLTIKFIEEIKKIIEDN